MTNTTPTVTLKAAEAGLLEAPAIARRPLAPTTAPMPKVAIGSNWRPPRFERRDRDGTYSAYMIGPDAEAANVQIALLPHGRRGLGELQAAPSLRSRVKEALWWTVGVVLFVVLWWLLAIVGPTSF